jgi:hypothetical protein
LGLAVAPERADGAEWLIDDRQFLQDGIFWFHAIQCSVLHPSCPCAGACVPYRKDWSIRCVTRDMKKEIPKVRKDRLMSPRNGTRQEGSFTKLKMKAEKKPKEKE